MVMGKGGVGKTTVAAAIAVALAKRGLPVHLTTTDPAQHIRETLQSEVAGLRVSYIDPKQEVRHYRERMLESARPSLSAEKLALLEEELKSPCYEEVAVFQAFSRAVIGARRDLVVIDTAPTGHTLLLLDTAGAYHRQLVQQAAGEPVRIHTPLMLLQDPEYTKVLIVTLPETTPVLEASALQDDLRRAQIEPFAWVINGSLAAAHPRDPVLRARASAEVSQILQGQAAACAASSVNPVSGRGTRRHRAAESTRPLSRSIDAAPRRAGLQEAPIEGRGRSRSSRHYYLGENEF